MAAQRADPLLANDWLVGLRHGRQRGECRRRPRRHRTDQWCCGRHPGRDALLLRVPMPAPTSAGIRDFLLTAAADRRHHQAQRLDLRRRGGLPGRGRLGLGHGRRRPLRRHGRHARAGRERRRDRARAPSRHDLRSGRRPGAGALHRAQRASARSRPSPPPRSPCKGDGTHFVPLDACIETMRQTGLDMNEQATRKPASAASRSTSSSAEPPCA